MDKVGQDGHMVCCIFNLLFFPSFSPSRFVWKSTSVNWNHLSSLKPHCEEFLLHLPWWSLKIRLVSFKFEPQPTKKQKRLLLLPSNSYFSSFALSPSPTASHPASSISLSFTLSILVIPPTSPNNMQPSELLHRAFVNDILDRVAMSFPFILHGWLKPSVASDPYHWQHFTLTPPSELIFPQQKQPGWPGIRHTGWKSNDQSLQVSGATVA